MEFLRKTGLILVAFVMQNAIAQDSKSLQDAFAKSYSFEKNAKYTDAIDALKGLDPSNNYVVALRLGWLYNLSKKYDESANFYRKATVLMPAAVEPLLGLVSPLANQKKWTEVEQVYLEMLQIDPKNSAASFRLGQIYYNRKDYAKAEKYFSNSLNLYPFDYDSMLMSAWNLYFLGKYGEAKELFQRVLLYNPQDTSAKEGLSMIK